MEHYRCHQIYVIATIVERVGDTVEFLPHHTNMPFISSLDQSVLAKVDLIDSLLYQNPEAAFAKIGETRLEALRQLTTLFQARL